MIKKTKNHGKSRYKVEVRIPDPNGKSKRVRRFCETLEQAKAIQSDLKSDIVTEGFWSALRPTQRLQVIRMWEQHTTTRQAAQDSAISLEEAASIYLKRKESLGLRASSLKFIRNILRRMNREVSSKQLSLVTVHDIERWFGNAGYSKSTVKGILNKLGPFFNWAIREGYCVDNPVKEVGIPIEDEKPPAIFTNTEVLKIFKAAQLICPKMVPYFALGFFAGLRPEEIKRLSWSAVQDNFIEIKAAKAKTRKRRLVSIEPNLVSWLRLGGDLPPINLRVNRQHIIKACGFCWLQDGMRHTYASNHLAHYENPNKTAHELGHRDTNMLYRHYRELVSNAAASEYWNILP
ncbi:MAG: hypothetical protein QF569_27930 [Candidatus Poribacteria bacterium]|nr:hypothetical protein [Candidatus Poribacteria bacterium]